MQANAPVRLRACIELGPAANITYTHIATAAAVALRLVSAPPIIAAIQWSAGWLGLAWLSLAWLGSIAGRLGELPEPTALAALSALAYT